MRYEPYERTTDVPNIVVDGSPNAATVLTLSHWPGLWAPPELRADLSAQMVFRYLDELAGAGRSGRHDAEVATNNHFDQDGLVGLFALVDPDAALARRDRLIDLAAAGDFGTYRHRGAARVSMLLSALAESDQSPWAAELAGIAYEEKCAVLYRRCLAELPAMIDHPDRYRSLWAEEDAQLTASEALLTAGSATLVEYPDADLAVVRVPDGARRLGGHRFVHDHFSGLHPMAVNNATERLRILLVHEGAATLTFRYETWVQLRSRRPAQRVDLGPLAARLDELEDAPRWEAAEVSVLAPRLAVRSGRQSSLDPDVVIATALAYLRTAPPAWDPYPPDPPAAAPD